MLVGSLLSNHTTRLEGTVYGAVATNGFTLFVPPTEYVNWLQDATIDHSRLPGAYIMPLFFSESPRMEVVKWSMDHGL
jgi:hypothetical protein